MAGPDRRPRLLGIVLSTMLALTFVACGEDEPGDATTAADEPAAFIAELDALCVANQEANVAAIGPIGYDAQNLEEQLEQTELTLQPREEFVSEAEALEAPEELSSDFDAYLSAQEELLAAGTDALAAGRDGDQKAYDEAIAIVGDRSDEAREIAGDMGATQCAGELSSEDEEAVTAVIEEVQMEATPGQCTELFTQSYLDRYFGKEFGDATNDRLLACEQFQESLGEPDLADRVEIDSILGPAPRATAQVTSFEGSRSDAATFVLIEEDDGWRVNDITISG